MTEVLIFDWDGTLSDSVARIVHCLQLAAAEVGLAVPSEAEGREIIGLGLGEALAQLFPGARRGQLDALKASYSRHYLVLDQSPAPFFAGVMETLHQLRDQGYRLAVATGKSRRGLDRVLDGHGLGRFFDATRCADETLSKPHPLMLQELLAHFAVDPHRACMVGDTEFDMAMAVSAGVPRIGVAYGAHCASRLVPYGLRGCLDRFGQIREIL